MLRSLSSLIGFAFAYIKNLLCVVTSSHLRRSFQSTYKLCTIKSPTRRLHVLVTQTCLLNSHVLTQHPHSVMWHRSHIVWIASKLDVTFRWLNTCYSSFLRLSIYVEFLVNLGRLHMFRGNIKSPLFALVSIIIVEFANKIY